MKNARKRGGIRFWRICAVALCALLLFSGGAAHAEWLVELFAEGPLRRQPKLIDSALVRVVRQTEYADWTLYQPTSYEIGGLDMTRDSHFFDRQFFPVIAIKANRTVLILLQREGEGWRVAGVNETALTREGLMLGLFDIDSDFQTDYSQCRIQFGFFDASGVLFQLHLAASTVDVTRFSSLSINESSTSSLAKIEARFSSHSSGMRFDNELTYRYSFQNPADYSIVQHLYPTGFSTDACKRDNFATFDLRDVPLSVFDIMEEGEAAADPDSGGQILLKQSASPDSDTLREVPEGARLSWVRPSAPFAERAWVLVAYEQTLGYLPRENVR